MEFVPPILLVVALLAAIFVRAPHIFLILGILSLCAATVFASTGRVWVRFNGWVYRDKEPGWFWWDVALYCLCGIWFVGYFFYKSHELLN
jgi:hypothetical protein